MKTEVTKRMYNGKEFETLGSYDSLELAHKEHVDFKFQQTLEDIENLNFSTPYLHYECMLSKRKLVSYENFGSWHTFFATRYGYQDEYHDLLFVEDYKDAKIEKPWDVVLIDQTPDTSRAETVVRLANYAKYIIIHDSGPKFDKQYGYDKIYPLFKYRTNWTKDTNNATVLSNFVDLKDFWK